MTFAQTAILGAARYTVKANAGWTRTRKDGSAYDKGVDEISALAENWAAKQYGKTISAEAMLSGDQGYDFVVQHVKSGRPCRVDVIHAGRWPDGSYRHGATSNIIVNQDNKKLKFSDVLLYVSGPQELFQFECAIHTFEYCFYATLKDFGHGLKWSLPASCAHPVETVLSTWTWI